MKIIIVSDLVCESESAVDLPVGMYESGITDDNRDVRSFPPDHVLGISG